MKKIATYLFFLLITALFLFASGCQNTKSPEPSAPGYSAPAEDEKGFNPDEPAPVPEGTPPYEEVQ